MATKVGRINLVISFCALLIGLLLAPLDAQLSTTRSVPSTSSTIDPAVLDDPCYDPSTGAPIKCVTDFINAAYQEQMTASGQCGVSGREQVCRLLRDRAGRPTRQCMQCDARNGRFGPQALTDLHNPNNSTCWISQRLERNDENVTLELALGKKYELTYVSIFFCSMRPDSLVIMKSVDFGRSWTPYQFYSSQCRKLFNRSPRAVATRSNEQEALCTQIVNGQNEDPVAANRVAFSTLEGRPSAYTVEESPILQDWMTATNIRIVILRLRPHPENITMDPEILRDTMFYSVADVAVGGRCKCNGHASRCKRNHLNKYVCDCRHNTVGDDCEKCRPFYQDRPWARGVIKNANECQKCNCNMHAKQCRFNKDLYLQTGKQGGGVCLKCKHHTAGRHCHFCAEGFFRDWTKAISHRRACRPCECHPVGAIDNLCNMTGQCRCKEGVTGAACDRCMPNYEQSRMLATPCVRVQSAAPNVEGNRESKVGSQCSTCASGRKVNLKKYCEGEYAIQAQLQTQESRGDWMKLVINVVNIIKKAPRIRRGSQEFWVRQQDLNCDCPRIRSQKHFLIISSQITDSRVDGLVLDETSIVVPWKDEWLQRLRKFQRDQRSGKCNEVNDNKRLLL